MTSTRRDDVDATFEAHRGRLFSLAYRMLGGVMDAEDVVQECWLRWRAVHDRRRDAGEEEGLHRDLAQPPASEAGGPPANAEAWLVRVATNLCLDELRSARARRETYVGPWLPEPLVTFADDAVAPTAATAAARSPAEPLALAESVTTAFLLLLERLSPLERAAWLLREAFDYDYPMLAAVLGRSEAACRQLHSRAARHVADGRPRFEVAGEEHAAVASRFLHAARTGDLATLEAVLAPDAVGWSDGGGRATAALRPVLGAAKVARLYAGIAARTPATALVRPALVNGLPGAVVLVDGAPAAVLAFRVVEGRIHDVYTTVNPEKLGRVGAGAR